MISTTTVLTPAADSLQSTLHLDFCTACAEFTEAREQQARKDTPAHRTAVVESLSRIDALLDMYLETRTAR